MRVQLFLHNLLSFQFRALVSDTNRDRDSNDSEPPYHGLPRPTDPVKKETGAANAVAKAVARPFTSPRRTPSEKALTTTSSLSSSPPSNETEPEQLKSSRSKLSKPRNRESAKPEEFSKV